MSFLCESAFVFNLECHPLVYSDLDLVWRNQQVISKELTHSITGHNPVLDSYIVTSNSCAGGVGMHLISQFAHLRQCCKGERIQQ